MKFRIDDAYAASAGSNAPWLQQVHSLDAGTHQLTWEYQRGHVYSVADDRALLDRVEVVPTEEIIIAPAFPTGENSGWTGIAYTYGTTGGSTSNLGHTVEYRFAWDDGTLRPWSSSPEASRTWDDAGDYLLRVQARCVDHPEYESYWSYSLIIFAVGETILPATRFPFFIFELLLE